MMDLTTLFCFVHLLRLTTAEAYYSNELEDVTRNVCNDGTICQHGSTCVKLEKSTATKPSREYRCDCSVTEGTSAYAGYECEHAASEYCFLGAQSEGQLSFCTNGHCTEIWMPRSSEESRHKGCDCDLGYEGDYCEYSYGKGPVLKTKIGAVVSWFVSILAVVIN